MFRQDFGTINLIFYSLMQEYFTEILSSFVLHLNEIAQTSWDCYWSNTFQQKWASWTSTIAFTLTIAIR